MIQHILESETCRVLDSQTVTRLWDIVVARVCVLHQGSIRIGDASLLVNLRDAKALAAESDSRVGLLLALWQAHVPRRDRAVVLQHTQ